MLKRVTITGADDKVDYGDLLRLQEEYPFVEWGVLLSSSMKGSARYPSWKWVLNMPKGLQWSAHFCGELTRTIMGGFRIPIQALEGAEPGRVQLNGYTPGNNEGLTRVVDHYPCIEFILQARDVFALETAASEARAMGHASVLSDPSGGRGLAVHRVAPDALAALRVSTGFAGGINSGNVVDVLRNFGEVVDWIDMETGVRTNDQLDLDKVRAVLEVARSYMNAKKVAETNQ